MSDLLLALAAWYACGVAGYGYWCFDGWRPAHPAEWVVALAAGVLGPVVPLAGWLVRLLSDDTPNDRDGGGWKDDRRHADDWRDGDRRLIPIRIDDRPRRNRRR